MSSTPSDAKRVFFDEPKPLVPGRYHMVCSCVCGRRVPDRELVALIHPPPCPDCGSILRMYEPTPVGWLTQLRAWLELRRWKKRRAGLYL